MKRLIQGTMILSLLSRRRFRCRAGVAHNQAAGNANDAKNQTAVNQSFGGGSLMQIRLRVGTVAGTTS